MKYVLFYSAPLQLKNVLFMRMDLVIQLPDV